ncbi:hypothetical protein D3C83_303080 [compost metagenome]
MTALEFGDDVVPRRIARFEQYGEVVDEVGGLGGQFGGIARDGRKRDFNPFLADLLREPLAAFAD